MNKKIITIVFMCICMFAFSVTSFASIQYVMENKEYEYNGKPVIIELDGEKLACDIPPIIHDARTLLPIRALIEKLGGEVVWDGNLQMITISLNETEISMIIGNRNAIINGIKKELEVIPCLAYDKDDTNICRTIIPLRFVMENLGLKVEWVDEEFKIKITNKETQQDKNDEKDEQSNIELDNIEEYMIKVGIYQGNNLKDKIAITAKTDILVGIISEGEFEQKDKIKKNSQITIEPNGKYLKVIANGKVLKNVKENEVIFVPKENSTGDKIITVDNLDYRGTANIILKDGKLMFVNELNIEQYLYSVVPSEMPPSFGLEAVKAQSLAARTYVITELDNHENDPFDVCSTIHCQVYSGMKTEKPLTTQAVEETKGEIITYKGQPISAYYSASMGGYTEDIVNVWGEEVEYLKAVEDPYEIKRVPGTVYFSKDEIEEKLDLRDTDIGDVIKVEITKWTESGRVYELVVTGTKGEAIYNKVDTRTFFNLKGQMYSIDAGKGLVGLAEDMKEYAKTNKNDIKYIEVQTGTLNVRQEPNLDSEKIGVVHRNEKFDILDKEDDFIKIEFENKNKELVQGWVNKKYVKIVEKEEEVTISKIAKVTIDKTNIMKEPDNLSESIGTAFKEHGYLLLEEKENWYKVIVGEEEGWINKDDAEIVEYDIEKTEELVEKLVKDGIEFSILITVYDNGHGVGMSQNGAKAMAEAGFNYKEILQFYYTGVEIQ